MQKVTKAVIPCAGFGTRFLPATKAIPKEMFPIIDIPSLQLIVKECVDSGITDVLIIISDRKQSIIDHFSEEKKLEDQLRKVNKPDLLAKVQEPTNMANIKFTYQYVMNGTANAVLLAKEFANGEPFALLYGDDLMYAEKEPVTKQLINAYEKVERTIVGCQTLPKELAIKYGVVVPGVVDGRLTEIKGFVEKPPIEKCPSTLASLGRYVLSPDIFDYIDETPVSPNGEKYITDTIQILADKVGAYAYDFEARRYDIGDKVGLVEALVEFGLRNPETKARLTEYLKNLDINKF
ncbi:MAG: UTP--glucose-1-phosphate uridylyltransferase [Clostridiales bacterium]|nr:UTP--glucose-1-phosphate uridylyltransferase [Clostridiales bacterium]